MNVKKILLFALVIGMIMLIPVVSASETGSNTPGFCNVIPAGEKIAVGKIGPAATVEGNDLTSKMETILRTTVNHQSYISHAGTSVTFRSKTWTVPATYMLHMGVNSLLGYSTDLVNWYSTGAMVAVSETGYTATLVDASTTVSVTGGRYYAAFGCHMGGDPDYHFDDNSGYIYVS